MTIPGPSLPAEAPERGTRLSGRDRELLMALQYHFPLTATPFQGVADLLHREEEDVLRDTERLLRHHVIKRIGFNVNFKTYGMEGALVGVACPEQEIPRLRDALFPLDVVTHNYVRAHPEYRVWFTYKARSEGSLLLEVEHLLGSLGLPRYVVLRSRRTYAVRVKFDLERGVSRSPEPLSRYVLPAAVPQAEDLGVPRDLLEGLGEGIPPVHEPYREVLRRVGWTAGQLEEGLPRWLDAGILRNGGATLRGPVVGFTHNAMFVFRTEDLEGTCERLAHEVPEATHVVLREVLHGDWTRPGYIMLHGTTRPKVEETARRVAAGSGITDHELIFSLQNLKP
jgi:DNA-binding Lrp family transcriptional regulator